MKTARFKRYNKKGDLLELCADQNGAFVLLFGWHISPAKSELGALGRSVVNIKVEEICKLKISLYIIIVYKK